jgi:YfiH family protein
VSWVLEDRGALRVHRLAEAAQREADVFVTERTGGVSGGPYASLNLGGHVGDDPERVAENRRRVAAGAGVAADQLALCEQVHGRAVVDADAGWAGAAGDALLTRDADLAIAVLVADCVPVVLVAPGPHRLAVAHAGWRGLDAGVLAATLEALDADGDEVLAGIGPSISRSRYQVGPEVAERFAHVAGAVHPDTGDRRRLDLEVIARAQLVALGVPDQSIVAIAHTTDEGDRFFSDRAARPCGRFALVARWGS